MDSATWPSVSTAVHKVRTMIQPWRSSGFSLADSYFVRTLEHPCNHYQRCSDMMMFMDQGQALEMSLPMLEVIEVRME